MDEMCTSQSALYSWGVFVGAASVIGRAAAAAAISCKYISKYQWELSVAVVALHYARQPLESSSEPVRPPRPLTLCVQLNAELHNAVRQTHMDEPADKRNRATQVRLIVAHTSRACCIPLQLCPTHTQTLGVRARRRRTCTESTVLRHVARIEELDH